MNNELIDKTYKVTSTGIYGFFREHRWLSNFHLSPVVFEGIEYPSNENAYQAAKTLDLDVHKKFSTITHAESKKFGKYVVIRKDWEQVKVEVMSTINFEKYRRHLDLREKLLATKGLYLEETNYWRDKTWGTYEGVGENKLGKILMNTRNYFLTVKSITK